MLLFCSFLVQIWENLSDIHVKVSMYNPYNVFEVIMDVNQYDVET